MNYSKIFMSLVFFSFFSAIGYSVESLPKNEVKRSKRVYINSARTSRKVHPVAVAQKKEKPNLSAAKMLEKKLSEQEKQLKIKEDSLPQNLLAQSDEDLEIQQVIALARKTENKIEETISKIEIMGEQIHSLPVAQKSLAIKNRRKLIDQTRVLLQMREEISLTIVSLDPELNVIFENEYDSKVIAQRLSRLEMSQLAHLIEEEMSQVSQQIQEISLDLDGFTSSLRKDIDSFKAIAALK